MKTRKIEIDVENYIELLENRKEHVTSVFNWGDMPQCLWDYFMDTIRECGINPANSSPKYVVDNAIINGDWGEFDEYKEQNETDDEFVERLKDKVFYINLDEKVVCFSL